MITLAEKTLDYWELSSFWNGRGSGASPTTGDALSKLSGILSNIGPQRKLCAKAYVLKEQIVVGDHSNDVEDEQIV